MKGRPSSDGYEFVKHANVLPDWIACGSTSIFKQKDRPKAVSEFVTGFGSSCDRSGLAPAISHKADAREAERAPLIHPSSPAEHSIPRIVQVAQVRCSGIQIQP